ncbi:hypothetical protein HWV62_40713 [Athelia sp. TMB]|nr:hypothetical protein HWV62_40713 [Athelia sp. TMB]
MMGHNNASVESVDAPPPYPAMENDAPPPYPAMNDDAPPPYPAMNDDAPPPYPAMEDDAPPYTTRYSYRFHALAGGIARVVRKSIKVLARVGRRS